MCVGVAASGHHKALAGVVHHLGLAIFNIGFGASLVAYIDVLAVCHGKGFYNLVAFGSEDLTIDHKVGTILYRRRLFLDKNFFILFKN